MMNPQGAEGQVEGGAAIGLGLALMEEPCSSTAGSCSQPESFTDYLIPTILDVPPVVDRSSSRTPSPARPTA